MADVSAPAGDMSVFAPSEDGPASEYQRWKVQAKALVEGPPEAGAVIVVATHETGRCLKNGINELRGSALAGRCRCIQVRRIDDCKKLLGLRVPIVVDASVKLWGTEAAYDRACELARGAADAKP